MLLELMAEFGVEPERTLMIGDTTHDLQLADQRRHRQRGGELRRARARGLPSRTRRWTWRTAPRELHDWLHASTPDAGDAADRWPQACASELAERGAPWVFDVLQCGQPARAFALRFDGRVVAYLNRCAHVPAEMDWQPGEFLDADRRWILCSIHGASYEPADGRCVGGPCGRGRLTPLEVGEADGQVYWYPSRDIRAGAA